MEQDNRQIMYRINCLASDLDMLYHQAAVKLGLSDSRLFTLYTIYEKNGQCSPKEICEETHISKQTIHSAVLGLEAEGILQTRRQGRQKLLCLTEYGRDYAERTVGRMFRAECNVFRDWTEEETNQYLWLMEKYNQNFRNQIAKMEEEF